VNKAWCSNKKVKKSFWGFGARLCTEYGKIINRCQYQKRHPCPSIPPPRIPKRKDTGMTRTVTVAIEVEDNDMAHRICQNIEDTLLKDSAVLDFNVFMSDLPKYFKEEGKQK